MSYNLAQQSASGVTCGWKAYMVVSGELSDQKLKAGDIVIVLNKNAIENGDDLASYLEEYTLPDGTLTLTVVRETRKPL